MNHTDKAQTRRALSLSPRKKTLHLTVCSVLTLFAAASVRADDFDVATHPLILGKLPEPNVVYIHDDSGSMAWSYVPDSRTATGLASRSLLYNKIAYDPDFKYPLPVDVDGNKFPLPSNKNQAWKDGFAATREAVNIQNQFYYSVYNKSAYHKIGYTNYSCNIPDLEKKEEIDEGWAPVSGVNYNESKLFAEDDCYTKVDLTTDADKENFRIWYSYYRTRIMSAKSGIGLGFSEIDGGIRLGFVNINDGTTYDADGSSKKRNITARLSNSDGKGYQGVKLFTDAGGKDGRKRFYNWLYSPTKVKANGGTPLRPALDYVGKYYIDNGNPPSKSGPWSSTPGESNTEANILSCRRSYAILMSDGYWDTTGDSVSVGNQDGDGASNTLADVAMKYYKTDLVPNLADKVPVTDIDKNEFQHMNTFTVGFGVKGKVDEDHAWAGTATWEDPTKTAQAHPSKIDDMLHAAVNSKGGYFSARNPEEFTKAIKAILGSIVNDSNSVAPMAVNSSLLSEGNLSFQASFDSENWSGDVYALKYSVPRDADDKATGIGSFSTTEWKASKKMPAPESRNIITWKDGGSGSNGALFKWSSLSTAQKSALGSENVLNWLRGDSKNEVGVDGGTKTLRSRGKGESRNVLGDFVNSGLAYVAAQNYGYSGMSGLTAAERNSYATRNVKSRTPMVYVGGNDGMLHGFNAKTGVEAFAYIPKTVFGKLANLADPLYKHDYFVDGTPRVSDAYVGGWKSVLVGSTGAGGNSYFAIDVENPGSLGVDSVMWEFTHEELGATIGQAAIGKTQSGQWVAIFGNGYNTKSHKAQLFVVDLASGKLLKLIDTGVGTVEEPNGLSSPVAVDINRDGLIDMVYAGDYRGNLWKFKFNGDSSGNWGVAYRLFKAEYDDKKSGESGLQPITSAPAVRFHPQGGVMVYFGTGKFFMKDDQEDKSVQSFYGVRDECGLSVQGSCGSDSAVKVTHSQLQKQSILFEQKGFTVDNVFDKKSTYKLREISAIGHDIEKKGFYMNLISYLDGKQGERVVVAPNLSFYDRVIFSSTIPDADPCGAGISSWMMAVHPFSGANPSAPVFDLNNDVKFDDDDKWGKTSDSVPGGIGTEGMGHSSVMHGQDEAVGCIKDACFSMLPDSTNTGRQAWQQLL